MLQGDWNKFLNHCCCGRDHTHKIGLFSSEQWFGLHGGWGMLQYPQNQNILNGFPRWELCEVESELVLCSSMLR